ncbi:glycerol-3-phosphate phosphatase [Penaeus vannamei]|uniref:Phosphoglycolate phosphatase n=1 Tax=Penaeus vannamei TaxID=6689 RepID=A0A3R7Q051_PENVA|nr:glycerol-3-phosphate phosphatase-like [Penaeus vannamei]ROT82562.1 Phosphoglycolate phosphatase [Penaeus vannamei]
METLPMSMDRDSLIQLLSEIDTVLLDCDGVLWQGAQGMDVIPRSREALERLKQMGKRVFLITNNSTKTQDHYFAKCRQLGFNVEKDHILSSPYIAAQYLKEIGFDKKAYIIGSPGLAEEIQKVGITTIGTGPETIEGPLYNAVVEGKLGLDPGVGAVVVGFDRDFNYDKLLRATCYLKDPDCLFIATNTDEKYIVQGTNYHLPAAGIIVNAIEAASERPARVMGKPSLNIFHMLQARFNLQPEKTLLFGDTLHTDILFGNESGMWSILVLSGVSTLMEARELPQDPQKQKQLPLFYLQSLGDILTLMDEQVNGGVNEQQN